MITEATGANQDPIEDVITDFPATPAEEGTTPPGEGTEVPATGTAEPGAGVDPEPEEPTAPTTTFDPPSSDDLTGEGTEGTEGGTPTDDDDVTEFYSGVSGILKDNDFFKSEVGEIKSEADFTAAMEAEVNSRLSEKQKEILELQGQGVSIPAITRLNQGLNTLNNIDEGQLKDSEDLRKNLIVADFTEKGFSEEDAHKYYGMIKKSGTDIEEAAKALEVRKGTFVQAIAKVKSDAVADKKNQQDRASKQLSDLATAMQSTSVLGRTVGASTIAKLEGLVSTPVGHTQSGEPMNAVMKFRHDNPVDFEHKLTYLFLVTNGFKDLKSFDRSAETRVSSRMRGAVNKLSSSGHVPGSRSDVTTVKTIDMNTIDDVI